MLERKIKELEKKSRRLLFCIIVLSLMNVLLLLWIGSNVSNSDKCSIVFMDG